MRLALIGPVSIEFDAELEDGLAAAAWDGYEPPLGVLTLASILRKAGSEPKVFDLDGFIREVVAGGGHPYDAFQASVAAISAIDCDVLGFGTICGSYPLTLRIAGEVRRVRPEVRIALGGPQASATDLRTLEAFDCIDAVVRGEADQIVGAALEEIAGGGAVRSSGVTWRHGGLVVRNVDAAVVLDLDAVPAPAYDLCRYMSRCSRLPIEIGRGCPFACTFCSTNDFFRRRFRLRSPECVLREMRRLDGLYGVTDFDLVHDMFTVDRKRVVEFCSHMEASRTGYTWHCSARTDFVDRDLIERMRAAGCAGLFFGVETGSARLQKIIGKELGIAEAARAVELAHEAGMHSTVSLIVGFPEETKEDLHATAAFAFNAARFDPVSVQVGMLAALPGTPLHRTWRDELVFDGIMPEQSHQSWGMDVNDALLISRHPEVFPSFYGVPAGAGREYTSEFRWFIRHALKRCRWLAVAMGRERDSLAMDFDRWLEWVAGKERPLPYYRSLGFAEDLCRFVMECCTDGTSEPELTRMMAVYYGTMYEIVSRPVQEETAGETACADFTQLAPRIAANITIVEFPFRPAAGIEALREKRAVNDNCMEPCSVAFQRQGAEIAEERELADLAAKVLRLCNGQRSVRDLAREAGNAFSGIPEHMAEEFLIGGLRQMSREGLIEMPLGA